MPLPIRDGNQSLTTLSTILVSNSHIPAHTVVSLGTQAITDIATAVSGVELGPNTLNALENITVTLGQVTITGGLTDAQLRASAVTVGGGVYLADAQSVIGSSIPPEVIQIGGKNVADSKLYPIAVDSNGVQSISGAVTASISGTPSVTFGTAVITGSTSILNFPATQTVTFSEAPVTFGLIAGTVTANPTGTQTIAGSVTIGAGTAQIGSVTASISGTIPISISSVTIGNSITISNFPATQPISISSVTIGNVVTISGTVTSNLGLMESVVATEGITASGTFVKIGGHTGTSTTGHIVHVSAVGALRVDGSNYTQPISGSVTASISNSVTIGSLPAISGTVTANLSSSNLNTVTIGVRGSVTVGNTTQITDSVVLGFNNVFGNSDTFKVDIRTPDGSVLDGEASVPVQGTVDIGSLPAISGTVMANAFGLDQGDGTSSPKIPIISFDTAIDAGQSGYVVPVQISNTAGAIGGSNALPISGTVTVGNSVTIGSLPAISGTVTANVIGTRSFVDANAVTVSGFLGVGGWDTVNSQYAPLPLTDSGTGLLVGYDGNSGNPFPISGTVTANLFGEAVGGSPNEPTKLQCDSNGFLITSLHRSGSDAVNYDPVAGNVSVNVKNVSSVTIGNSVTISSLPALVAGTAQIGSVTASISNSVTIGSIPAISGTVTANTFAVQGTAVTTSNFTSTTASTVLANYNATREVLTIFNEGAGNLHICAGATCTTIAYQVRLSAGDYYEVPNHQTTITHSAVFATAGTARVTQLS